MSSSETALTFAAPTRAERNAACRSPQAMAILRVWPRERAGGPADAVFPTRIGRRLSEDAVEARLAAYREMAAQDCTSLAVKRLTPHVLRHTCAMNLLREGVDAAVIALWLGHADMRSTNAYLHADMSIKTGACPNHLTVIPGRTIPTLRQTAHFLGGPVIIPNNSGRRIQRAPPAHRPPTRAGRAFGIIAGSG